MAGLKQRNSELEAMIDKAKSSTDQIVVFGVFLLAITLMGIVTTIMLQGLGGAQAKTAIQNLNRLKLDGGGLVLPIVAVGLALMITGAFKLAQRPKRVRTNADEPRPPPAA